MSCIPPCRSVYIFLHIMSCIILVSSSFSKHSPYVLLHHLGYIAEYSQPLWNLPFCVNREEKQVICQTNAVFTHLGRACAMLGDDEASTSQCEQLLCEIYDLRNIMTNFAYRSDGR